MVKVGEHITIDFLGVKKDYTPEFYEKIIYTIAKAALLGLTRTFAKDLGAMGITVNMVSGGLLKVTDASAATPDAVFDAIAEMTPLQKVTTTEDFSDAVLFFASDQSRSITGQNLTVDGGLTFN